MGNPQSSFNPFRQFTELVTPVPALGTDTIAEGEIRYDEGTLYDAEAYLGTWAAAIQPMIEMIKDAGYSAKIPEFMKGILSRAIDKGWGNQDIGALIKLLRPDGRWFTDERVVIGAVL